MGELMVTQVTAEQLRPGDLTVGSGTRILSWPQRGIHTPGHQVELLVERRSGKRETVLWNRRTRMRVARRKP